jgi:predicted ATPase
MEMAHTSELVMVHGPSGAGKSALIKEFVDSLPPEVFHMQGKFDQLQSHAPYAALVAASDHLCRQILRRENGKMKSVYGTRYKNIFTIKKLWEL